MSQSSELALYIRPLTLTDLPDVILVHIGAFPDSALTKLGGEAVRRYYEWLLVGPHDALNIGAFAQAKMIGFCFGGIFRGALGGFLEKNRGFLMRRVATHPWLLLNPLFRERAQFALSRLAKRFQPGYAPSSPKPAPLPPPNARSFGILSIAVAPQHQGSSAARFLMEYSEQVAVERDFSRMGLTVHPSNGRAVRFYEKMGWQRDIKGSSWDGHMSKAIGVSDRPEEETSKTKADNG